MKSNLKKGKEIKLKNEAEHSNGGAESKKNEKTFLMEEKNKKHEEMFGDKDKDKEKKENI